MNKISNRTSFFPTEAEYQIVNIGRKKGRVVIAVQADKSAQMIIQDNSEMMALHSGSRVYVKKDDILGIFCDKPALYSVRLAELVFGDEVLQRSCLPDEINPKYEPLDAEILNAIIGKRL